MVGGALPAPDGGVASQGELLGVFRRAEWTVRKHASSLPCLCPGHRPTKGNAADRLNRTGIQLDVCPLLRRYAVSNGITFPRATRLSSKAILALASGFARGIAVSVSGNAALAAVPRFLEPIGTLWVNALRMTVRRAPLRRRVDPDAARRRGARGGTHDVQCAGNSRRLDYRDGAGAVVGGLPAEAVGLLIGVDAIPDMVRTVANVTGDMAVATILARFEPA